MSSVPRQTPLGINTLGGLLQDTGLSVNPIVTGFVGTSKVNEEYSPGSIVNDTCLKELTYAIHDAYIRGEASSVVVLADCNIANTDTKTVLTVGQIVSGIIKPGMIVTDDQGLIQSGTFIVACLSGSGTTPGSTWQLSKSQVSGTVPDGIITGVSLVGTTVNTTVSSNVYSDLISFSANTIPALGNYPPPTYLNQDPSGVWQGEATSGYSIPYAVGQGQEATWLPYDLTNPNHSVTEWGFIRLLALQGWNEFNWNGVDPKTPTPEYKDFCSSFATASGFIDYSNNTINSMTNSKKFLKGTFSNTNDLMTSDVSGVNLALPEFGRDLQNLGRAFDLSRISTFGLPSSLLITLNNNNAINNDLNLALLAAELSIDEIQKILKGTPATKEQEQKIYGAFLIIVGESLAPILIALQCNTSGLTSLADLLNVKMILPNSYKSLTVPIYNTTTLPTNSKTYYFVYAGDSVNSQLTQPAIVDQIGTQAIIPVSQTASSPALITANTVAAATQAVNNTTTNSNNSLESFIVNSSNNI